LVGSLDFGRCPLASRIPTALWPVVDRPVLERLLVHLAEEGVNRAAICSNGDAPLLTQSFHSYDAIELQFLHEELSEGTAGCIRNAAETGQADELLLVFPASVVNPPRIDTLVSAHLAGKSGLTVMFNPGSGDGCLVGPTAGIYVCDRCVLEHIPEAGYFDIKENLIPEMLRSNKTIHAARLPNHAGNFRDRPGYLSALGAYLENASRLNAKLKLCTQTGSEKTWIAADATADPSVRTYGPVVIMGGAAISKGVVIFGPTIVGRNVNVGNDCVLVSSVLWDHARVGSNCEINKCVVDYHATVYSNTVVEEQSIPFKPASVLENAIGNAVEIAKNRAGGWSRAVQLQLCKINDKLPDCVQLHNREILLWLAGGLVLIGLLWSYWSGLAELWNIWQKSDEYSAGLLVPFLAVYVLWSRRREIAECRIRPSAWGIPAFLAAQGLRFFGLFFMYCSAERLSIVLSIAALVLLLFGRQVFRKVSTVLLFLFLTLPWPTRIQALVALPLQRWATSSAVFCLEMIGYDVFQEGNIIHAGQATVAVAEACNGLRMITAFFVISSLVALLVRRKRWEKLIIVALSLPIALLCNTVRLAVTAIAFTVVGGEYWEKIFHDFGGYAMMPLALAAVVAELWLLTRLTTEPTEQEAIVIKRQGDN